MSKNHQMEKAIMDRAVQTTYAIAEKVERQLDDAISHFDNISQDELGELRKKRLAQLQEKQQMMETWKAQGHGKLEEIAGEKDWFHETKTNKWVVCHFYRSTTPYCEILDSHLQKLAPKHMETRFIKIDAEKCAYLVTRLNITIMPTLIMTEDIFVADKLEGFTELGDTDKFTTETLATRLAKKGLIGYVPPPPGHEQNKNASSVKTNKSGAAIYESVRTKMLETMDMDDDFLNTTDEEV